MDTEELIEGGLIILAVYLAVRWIGGAIQGDLAAAQAEAAWNQTYQNQAQLLSAGNVVNWYAYAPPPPPWNWRPQPVGPARHVAWSNT